MKKGYLVTYKNYTSTVTKKIYLKIMLIKLYLKYIVRTRRLLRRLIKYLDSVIYTLVIISLYILGIYFIGKHFQKYNSILGTLWETKGTIMSSILIVYVTNAIKQEKERNKRLKEQFNFYESIYYIADTITCAVLELINYPQEYYIYRYEFEYNKFFDDFSEFTHIVKFNKHKYKDFLNKLKDISFDFETYSSRFYNQDFISCDLTYPDLRDHIKCINELLFKISKKYKYKKTDQLIDTIKQISDELYFILSKLRRPWRWDLKMDLKIIETLTTNNITDQVKIKYNK